MNRQARLEMAVQTVRIIEQGVYRSANGKLVNISDDLNKCLSSTRYFSPEELEQIYRVTLLLDDPAFETKIEVVNETTLDGIRRVLHQEAEPVAALNFASARNPGGGFLGGSQAQEESLARSSALYGSLLKIPEFYERHRNSPSLLYSDAMILSPLCPVFREDDGALLDEPYLATFITSAAPNAGAIAKNQKQEVNAIAATLRRRSRYILALAASFGYRNIVLGAWGCGVFQNDPRTVAATFAEHLRGDFKGRFQCVTFSVFDTSADQDTFGAFQAYVK